MKTGVENRVSTVRGRWQIPALRSVTAIALATAVAGLTVPALTVVAVGLVSAVPLVRVLWLAIRYAQERDWRFVTTALGVLTIVLTGVVLAAAGIGA